MYPRFKNRGIIAPPHPLFSLKDPEGRLLEATPEEMWQRLVQGVTRVEKGATQEFSWLFSDFRFVPGGRILFGLGNWRRSTLFNCYYIPIREDSVKGITRFLDEAARTFAYGGGVGSNADALRPKGAKVPATLEEFVALSKKLSQAEGGPVYWFQPDASTFAYFFFNLGGSYLKNGKLVLNSKEAVEALTLLQNGVKEGWAKAITSGYINQNLGSGPYAFSVDTSAGYTYYRQGAKFDLGVATLPGRTKGQPGFGLVQGTNLVVFRQASKEEQAVAKDFLQFVLSPRAQAVFATATGYVPVTEGALKDAVYQTYATENPHFATIVRQSRYAKFEPALAEWEQIRFDILGQAIKEAILNKADPKSVLDKAQKLAEDLLSGKIR
ncbi:extracellular solute-binding protein [Thermus scotoductus]|uniref:extracellular solute-binding protein n=1 Tax=Thermus scotoductus TaxID=37636 RepID=UPI0020A3EA25|nr:extracellular solute-binding protein [Thermus scotoductus]